MPLDSKNHLLFNNCMLFACYSEKRTFFMLFNKWHLAHICITGKKVYSEKTNFFLYVESKMTTCSHLYITRKKHLLLWYIYTCGHNLFTVTNPIEVVKIRMQLDNQLSSRHQSKNIFHDRYYKGLIRVGLSRVYQEEGIRGLYLG